MAPRARTLVLVAAAALLAIAGWRLLGPFAPPEDQGGVVERPGGDRVAPPSDSSALDLERATEEASTETSTARRVVPGPTQVMRGETGEVLVVRVVDGEGVVVEGATVAVDWLVPRAIVSAPRRPAHPVAVRVREEGAPRVFETDTATTDGFGAARLPWRGLDLEVTVTSPRGAVVRSAKAYELERDDTGARVLEVGVMPRTTLRVLVTDLEGRAIDGHEVRLTTTPHTHRAVLAWARTDSSGRARFEDWTSYVDADVAYVFADWPTMDSMVRSEHAFMLERDSPPEEEVVLRIGDTGVIQAIWEPSVGRTRTSGDVTFTANSMGGYGRHVPTVRGGTVGLFRRIPVGHRTWTVEGVDSHGRVARGEVVGPSRPGEIVRVRLQPEGRRRRTEARLVGPSGDPLAHASVEVQRFGGPVFTGTTDARGRVVFEEEVDRLASRRGVRWSATADGISSGAMRHAPPPKDGIDLGDIHLVRAMKLVDATVVDEAGEALADTDVTVVAATPTRRARVRYDSRTWGIQWPARTDGEGRLVLVDVLDGRAYSGDFDALTFRLRVERDGFDPFHLFGDLEPCAQGTRVVVQRPGMLSWSVEPEDALDGVEVRWRLVPRDGETTPFRRARREADGLWHFASVMPGRFDLEAWTRGPDERLIARHRSVEVESGSATTVRVAVDGAR